MKKIIGMAITIILSLTFIINAETNHCDTTKIYFVNGVWNSLAQARDGEILIRDAYKQTLEKKYPNQKFEFNLAHNYSAGKVRDLIEVIGQKLNEINDADANKFTASQYYNLYMTAKAFDEVVPRSAKLLTTTIEEYLAGRMTDSVNAEKHIQKYQTDLQEGKNVLLIAHSQGNLFANQAVASLMNSYSNNLGMIGVASPAAITYNNSTYYTAHDDRVIDALRVLHDVLPSNIENDPGVLNDSRDFSNHQFNESYFASGIASRTKINQDVNNFMEKFQCSDDSNDSEGEYLKITSIHADSSIQVSSADFDKGYVENVGSSKYGEVYWEGNISSSDRIGLYAEVCSPKLVEMYGKNPNEDCSFNLIGTFRSRIKLDFLNSLQENPIRFDYGCIFPRNPIYTTYDVTVDFKINTGYYENESNIYTMKYTCNLEE